MFSKAKAWPLYYSPAEDYFLCLKINPGRPLFPSIFFENSLLNGKELLDYEIIYFPHPQIKHM